MRVLNVNTYEFAEYFEPNVPRYAILSHRWEEDEVLFADVGSAGWMSKAGFAKIRFACQQASDDGLEFLWVDTCNIDKSSSAELSEAINSMFRWYRDAKICYAFLSDVSIDGNSGLSSEISQSQWFRRGWTLQELIAPNSVTFFDVHWRFIGTRSTLSKTIAAITDIPNEVLSEKRGPLKRILDSYPAATRMSWAASRITKRIEDRAYSLLGLFGVNMSLTYGEGPRAFIRLQEEIIKLSNDLSILAWNRRHPDPGYTEDLLALGPEDFRNCNDLIFAAAPAGGLPWGTILLQSLSITSTDLRVQRPLLNNYKTLSLGCRSREDLTKVLALGINFLGFEKDHRGFETNRIHEVENVNDRVTWIQTPSGQAHGSGLPTMTILREKQRHNNDVARFTHIWVDVPPLDERWTVRMVPDHLWDPRNSTLDLQKMISSSSSHRPPGKSFFSATFEIIRPELQGFTIRIKHKPLTTVHNPSWVTIQIHPYDENAVADSIDTTRREMVPELFCPWKGYTLSLTATKVHLPDACIVKLLPVVHNTEISQRNPLAWTPSLEKIRPRLSGQYVYMEHSGSPPGLDSDS